jgi:hypothetical protein
MKNLYLTVEGQTEEAFARDVLQPHLAGFDVFVWPPRFTGPHGRRKGRIPRGGMANTFRHTLEDIRRWLKENQSADARFSMMLDLYGLPKDFPGYDEAVGQPDCYQQARIMEEALAAQLGDRRFVPYLQVHEFEALVLTEPGRLAEVYPESETALPSLAEECAAFPSPEHIDHGAKSHPKSRIHAVIPEYDENVAGPLIASAIGVLVLRRKCVHFGEWLTRLEQLDRAGEP